MKMVMAVVQADDVVAISDALVNAGYRVTRMATTGGWLRRENATLLLGVEDNQVSHVLRLLQNTGSHRTTYVNVPTELPSPQEGEMMEVQVGGATVFVLDIERFERY
ncbi:MAG: cyclic-di-AMP receptor [Chloroflexi bacterium]|nr:cyclic-di-AMP receptor [Chloroflexota bacterium]MCL5274679.1 cyclic-di-AMP receptor [Chloroflexota bacterium]